MDSTMYRNILFMGTKNVTTYFLVADFKVQIEFRCLVPTQKRCNESPRPSQTTSRFLWRVEHGGPMATMAMENVGAIFRAYIVVTVAPVHN